MGKGLDRVIERGGGRRALSGPLTAAGDEGRPVVVLVDDRARVQPHILDLAEKQAARVYKHAGATMVWRAAREPVVNAGFTVRLVIQAEFRGASGAASPFLMGAAPDTSVECGGVAYLFFDQIMAFSNILLRDPALVLGRWPPTRWATFCCGGRVTRRKSLMRASWKPDDWNAPHQGPCCSHRPNGWQHARISDCREGG